jgi:hypothetical protein
MKMEDNSARDENGRPSILSKISFTIGGYDYGYADKILPFERGYIYIRAVWFFLLFFVYLSLWLFSLLRLFSGDNTILQPLYYAALFILAFVIATLICLYDYSLAASSHELQPPLAEKASLKPRAKLYTLFAGRALIAFGLSFVTSEVVSVSIYSDTLKTRIENFHLAKLRDEKSKISLEKINEIAKIRSSIQKFEESNGANQVVDAVTSPSEGFESRRNKIREKIESVKRDIDRNSDAYFSIKRDIDSYIYEIKAEREGINRPKGEGKNFQAAQAIKEAKDRELELNAKEKRSLEDKLLQLQAEIDSINKESDKYQKLHNEKIESKKSEIREKINGLERFEQAKIGEYEAKENAIEEKIKNTGYSSGYLDMSIELRKLWEEGSVGEVAHNNYYRIMFVLVCLEMLYIVSKIFSEPLMSAPAWHAAMIRVRAAEAADWYGDEIGKLRRKAQAPEYNKGGTSN